MKFPSPLFLLLLVAATVSSCTLLLGIEDPKTESVAGLYRYYYKMGVDTSLVIFLRPEYQDSLMLETFKAMPQGFRPIQFRLFGPDGNIVSHYASCEGPLYKFDVLDTFPARNLTPLNATLTLEDELKRVDSRVKPIHPESGYTMFIYSQRYLGKVDKIITKKVLAYSQKEGITNIYVFNMDMR